MVNISIGGNPSFYVCLILGIKVNLEDTLSIDLASGPLSSDFSGVDNIVKDGLLNSSQSSGTGSKSLGFVRPGEGFSKDGTLGNNDNLASREFLLELTDKTLLNLVERFEKLVGNVKDDGLTSSSTVNLLCGGDVEVTEGGLEISGSHLKVEKLLGDRSLELIGFLQGSAIQKRTNDSE